MASEGLAAQPTVKVGKCTITSRQPVPAEGFRWLRLERIQYEDPQGRSFSWESAARVTRPAGADCDGVVVLAKVVSQHAPARVPVVVQYRPPMESYVIELPAGMVDPGQSVEQTAVRELHEETGLSGRVLQVSSCVLPEAPGMSNSTCRLALMDVDGDDPANANACAHPHAGEVLQCVLLPYDSLLAALLQLCAAVGSGEGGGGGGVAQQKCVVDMRLYAFAAGLQLGRAVQAPPQQQQQQQQPVEGRAKEASAVSASTAGVPAAQEGAAQAPGAAALQQQQQQQRRQDEEHAAAKGSSTLCAEGGAQEGQARGPEGSGPAPPAPGTAPVEQGAKRAHPHGLHVGPAHRHVAARAGARGNANRPTGHLHPSARRPIPEWQQAFLEQLTGLDEHEIHALMNDADLDHPGYLDLGSDDDDDGDYEDGDDEDIGLEDLMELAAEAAVHGIDLGFGPGFGGGGRGGYGGRRTDVVITELGDGEEEDDEEEGSDDWVTDDGEDEEEEEEVLGEERAATSHRAGAQKQRAQRAGARGQAHAQQQQRRGRPGLGGRGHGAGGAAAAAEGSTRGGGDGLLSVRGWASWAREDPLALACGVALGGCTLSLAFLGLRAYAKGA